MPTPQPHDNRWHRTFPGERQQVRHLRRFVRAYLPSHPDAELIASELAANAVEHTHSGRTAGTFTATLEQRPDGSALMTIDDQGGPSTFNHRHPEGDGGRGLMLVTALTTAWGVKGDATGRTIWAELPPSS